MRVLIAEDDELLGECISCGLNHYYYNADWVKNGLDAWVRLQAEIFDIVVLDLELPKLCGEEVLKNMRANNIAIPVIIVSSHNSISDRVQGLNIGADDYIGKPFELDELCARIRTIQRRIMSRVGTSIAINNIMLDMATREVLKFGQNIELSSYEFTLLQILMKNAGQVFSRKKILDYLYGGNVEINSNTLDVHIHNLRRKLGANTIVTCHGEGYVFVKDAP